MSSCSSSARRYHFRNGPVVALERVWGVGDASDVNVGFERVPLLVPSLFSSISSSSTSSIRRKTISQLGLRFHRVSPVRILDGRVISLPFNIRVLHSLTASATFWAAGLCPVLI
jgi:hypothetical protein